MTRKYFSNLKYWNVSKRESPTNSYSSSFPLKTSLFKQISLWSHNNIIESLSTSITYTFPLCFNFPFLFPHAPSLTQQQTNKQSFHFFHFTIYLPKHPFVCSRWFCVLAVIKDSFFGLNFVSREMKSEDQRRSLFGISLSDRSKWQQFLICSSGFFFGYLVNGVCEEYVYNRLQFSYGWYFTFVQGFVYLVLIYLQGFTTKQMVNPWKTYVKLSAVLMGSHGLTKGSLAFLNYPAQIMFKSTKVLPVMIMGAFIPGLRRKYPLHEYISALMLVVGLILFTLADAQTSPNFSMIGVIMICGALFLDSLMGNLQEAIFTMNPDTTQIEVLFCSTVVGLPMLIPPMILTGELFKAWNSCAQHPYVYGVLVFEAMATFIGQVSVLSLIALFGAATTAMITTARKAVTLLLSYLIFTKPLTEQHGTGLLLISMGIILKMLPESKPPSRSAPKPGKSHVKEEKKLADTSNGEGEGDEERRPLV